MNPLLVLIDLQADFLSDRRIRPSAQQVVAGASRLLKEFRSRRLPVAHVRTEVDPGGDDRMPHWKSQGVWSCVSESEGALPPDALREAVGEAVIRKTFFSGFGGGHLIKLIEDRRTDTLVICGVHIHGCVRQTILEAYERGLESVVVAEAIGGYDPLHTAISREYLEGRGAHFVSIERLFARLRDGSAPLSPDADHASPFVHRSPRDPDESWEVPNTEGTEIMRLARSAKRTQPVWQSVDYPARARVLMRTADALAALRSMLVDKMVREVGKPISMCRAEIESSADALRAMVNRFARNVPQAGGAEWRRRPLGVVVVITPWNNPIYIPVCKIAAALLMGNTVVWKPSPAAHQSALVLASALLDAGLPEGALHVVSGNASVARILMEDESVDAVSFTGSSSAGYDAQLICGRRRIPLQAELGGNNAAVVWPDADINGAALEIAHGAFGFAGQRCTANRRAVVHASVLPQFVEAVTRRARTLRWGDPLNENTVIGPVLSAEKARSIESILNRVSQTGGDVERVAGGSNKDESNASPAYCAPAIVVCDEMESEIVQEETFGPVLVVQRATDWEHAIRLTNGVRQGLVASLFSSDKRRWSNFQDQIEAGILKRNQGTAGAKVDVPFGGWKSSGIGPPEHGDFDREFFTRVQTVYE